MFIAFEGPEGSGKTTQLQRLAESLRARGREVVTTKEPGGTPLADRIRAILLHPESSMDSLTELLLYAASRRQNVVEVIRPALNRGAIVLCDRFTDATLAYQGFGRRLDLDRLRTINAWVTDSLNPDVTLLFDIDERVGLQRARSRNASVQNEEGRLEAENVAFHRRVREGYLALAVAEPERFVTIDAAGTIEEVWERVTAALRGRMPEVVR